MRIKPKSKFPTESKLRLGCPHRVKCRGHSCFYMRTKPKSKFPTESKLRLGHPHRVKIEDKVNYAVMAELAVFDRAPPAED